MFTRPLNRIFSALALVAGAAEKLQVRRIIRSAGGERMDMIDLKFGALKTCRAFANLFGIKKCDIVGGEGATSASLKRSSSSFSNVVVFFYALRVALSPIADIARNLFGILCAGFLGVFLGLFRIATRIVFAMLRRISGPPFSAHFLNAFGVSFFPVRGFDSSERSVGRVRVFLRKGFCAEHTMALNASTRAGYSLSYVTVLARFASEVSSFLGLQGFLPGNQIHLNHRLHKGVV